MTEDFQRYLLYIDILGFKELASNTPEKVDRLFEAVDSLNAHRHYAFKTIVFSDTILVFNRISPESNHDHDYLVMYACEFAQDLMYRCVALGIQFRAILTFDSFHYRKMENIEAYYGPALINAYLKEGQIVGMGLFIDKRIANRNMIFSMCEFDRDLNFVFITQDIERLMQFNPQTFPVDPRLIESLCDDTNLAKEIEFLQTIRLNIDKQTDSRIRAKYLVTFELFRNRYRKLVDKLDTNGYKMDVLVNPV